MDDAKLPFNTRLVFMRLITQYMERKKMVLRAGIFFKKKWLYFELMIYDKYRGKNTGPQCVKETLDSSPSTNRQAMPHQSVTEILHNCIFQNDSEKVAECNSLARRMYDEINNDWNAENYTLRITEKWRVLK
jgi:hypothetical protein